MKSKNKFGHYYDDMTPDERMEKVITILAEAVVKVAMKQQQDGIQTPSLETLKARLFDRKFQRSGIAPFGYRKENGKLITNPPEMVWINKIKKLEIEGLSTGKIARQLNAEDHSTKWAGKWDRSKVWRILRRQDTLKNN